jgi:hypothetical protein
LSESNFGSSCARSSVNNRLQMVRMRGVTKIVERHFPGEADAKALDET